MERWMNGQTLPDYTQGPIQLIFTDGNLAILKNYLQKTIDSVENLGMA